jgi:hypothetical protein
MNKKRILLAGIVAILVALGGIATMRAHAGDSQAPPPPPNKGQGIGEVRLGF